MSKTMTLEQAHKSGRKFRKKGTTIYHLLGDVKNLNGEDAFATIWELEDKETYTRDEVEKLLTKVARTANSGGYHDSLQRAELVMKILNEEY